MNFAKLSMAHAPRIRTEIPGPKSAELLDRQAARESNARTYPRGFPIAVARAQGATIEDVDGNIFLDFWGGAGTLNLGHNHPEVIAAAIAQISKATHTLDLPSAIKDSFTTEVLSLLPESLQGKMKVHFAGPTGADAVEGAIKLVKTATGRRSVISFQGGYHGMTHGALSLTGQRRPKEDIPGLMPDVHFAPYSSCYRCPLGLVRETCEINCATFLQSMVEDQLSGVVKPAGIILEAVQGEAGSIPADADFLRRVAAIAKRNEIPLILDEIQAGMGRTGKTFAFEHAGIEPDIIVMSKAIGGGGFPLAVILYREEFDVWAPGAHTGTFRGFLPAMAAGATAMRILRRDKVVEHAAEIGAHLRSQLKKATADVDFVGEVRGRGLMIGIEIVDPVDHSPGSECAVALRDACVQRGLVTELGGRGGAVIRMIPPLIITREQVDAAVKVFRDACAAVRTAYMAA